MDSATSLIWLRPQEVRLGLRLQSKRAVLDEVAAELASRTATSTGTVFDALWQRERLGSTALGHGVALPHARVPNLDAPVGAFLLLSQAVAFDAPDDKPVLFVLGLLLPQRHPSRQLELLAALAARFSDPILREALAAENDTARACRLITTGHP